jgi:hypothetical protein
MLFKRIEKLVNWRYSVKIYIEDNGTIPKNLFDVYSYCKENKKGIDLPLIIFPRNSMEESLLNNERILKDQITFVEKIDYEIVYSQKDWYVREKKEVKSKYLRISELLTINSEGNIHDHSLEDYGVVLIDDLPNEKTN